MRDKQAFEAFVLEKSRVRKQEIQRRRRTIITSGMSLCICLLVVVCVTAVWKPWKDNGTALNPSVQTPSAATAEMAPGGTPQMTGAPTATDEVMPGSVASPEKTMPQASMPQATMPLRTNTPQPSAPKNTPLLSAPPQATMPPNVMPPQATMPTAEALPFDEAFAQGASDYALPDKIEVVKGAEIQNADKIRQICDWILQRNSEMNAIKGEGDINDAETYMLQIYYGERMIICYLDSENALFKMEGGPWLAVDAADVAAFKGFFDN